MKSFLFEDFPMLAIVILQIIFFTSSFHVKRKIPGFPGNFQSYRSFILLNHTAHSISFLLQ